MSDSTGNREEHGGSGLEAYLIGFVLAVILTVIPFWMVVFSSFSRETVYIGVAVAALFQILVHLHYFLHLGTSRETRANLISIIFTALIVVVMIGGSLWIMFDLHFRMIGGG